MKVSDTLQFLYRFRDLNQKKQLKKLADKQRHSLNHEIHVAIEDHIDRNKKLLK